jgi:hypothetical protein
MSNVKISGLPTAATVADTAKVPVVQGGATEAATALQVAKTHDGDFASLPVLSSGYVSIGAGVKPTSGLIRFPYNGGGTTRLIGVCDATNVNANALSYGPGHTFTAGNTGMNYNIDGFTIQLVSSVSAMALYANGGYNFYDYNTGRFVIRTTGHGVQFGATTSFGDGSGVVGITNAVTVPASNPTGGGIIFAEAGALKYRGSSGTVTTIAPA